jgi:hypothetical protein
MRESYLPREAQEACLDCAAELTDAPPPAAAATSSTLNSLICLDRTTGQKIQNQWVTLPRRCFLSLEELQIYRSQDQEVILTQLGQEPLAPNPMCDTYLTSVGYPISISCSLCTAGSHRDPSLHQSLMSRSTVHQPHTISIFISFREWGI